MKFSLYAIYDRKAVEHGAPAAYANEPVAVRAFADLVNGNGVHGEHPEDFSLVEVGSWDSSSGVVAAVEKRHVVEASAVKKERN